MKKHILRWIGAPLLALVLALVMAAAMAAPVWAAGESDENESSEPSAAPALTGISFSRTGPITLGRNELTQTLIVQPVPSGAELNGTITWTVIQTQGVSGTMTLPTFRDSSSGEEDGPVVTTATGTSASNQLISGGPGDFTVLATYNGADGAQEMATIRVIFSGITLSYPEDKDNPLTMLVGDIRTVTVDGMFGSAYNSSEVIWTSSDPSVVSVMNGELTAWQLSSGAVTITASKNGFTARFYVKVIEDDEAIASGYTATTSDPLILIDTFSQLDNICRNKTGERNDDGTPKGNGSHLAYITNVSVPTSQGVLYYNYVSEADTGAGVAITDRFAENPGNASAMLNARMLYFVPAKGFRGDADITFTGWSENGTSFYGTIRVTVGVGTGEDGQPDPVSYRTQAGEPVWFMTSDFNAYCQAIKGRDVNYVTFNLPQASEGVLYYNYIGGSGTPVSTTTQFSRLGMYTMNDVCFVPNAALASDGNEVTVTITFRGADTSGAAFTGEVKVTVTASNASSDPANVTIYGEKGQPVVLESYLFNDACRKSINDTLAYVTFKLPSLSEGALYYNYRTDGSYDSRVDSVTRYYYSGMPGISGVAFVPASDTLDRVAISYTGYGSAGTSFTGTLYISFAEEDRSTIRYNVSKNGSVTFNTSDFILASLYQMGVTPEYVVFDLSGFDYDLGDLYYDYRGSYNYGWVYGGGYYYIYTNYTWENRLSLISFHANDTSGSMTIRYTAYGALNTADYTRKSFTGDLVIQVGSATPSDVRFSCYNSEQSWLSASTVASACRPAMNQGLSYIEITGLPEAEKGHLYLNYSGFGTGTEVKEGDRFYYAGVPNISQLCFVPRAGFTGDAEITYIGYSYSGDTQAQEQVSGRIVITVASSTASRYFSDMGGHVWAVDSVDYLRTDGTVEGIGGGLFNPTGIMTKGDFTLMLVRAYGLTASGSVSFYDVPSGSYYADAVRVAALLGVAEGRNGYFYPGTQLTRQDAMVMICNALRASGKVLTNGLTADFSVYSDERELDPDAREAVGILIQMGVVKGDGYGHLRPNALLSRAEVAVLLHTIMTL